MQIRGSRTSYIRLLTPLETAMSNGRCSYILFSSLAGFASECSADIIFSYVIIMIVSTCASVKAVVRCLHILHYLV